MRKLMRMKRRSPISGFASVEKITLLFLILMLVMVTAQVLSRKTMTLVTRLPGVETGDPIDPGPPMEEGGGPPTEGPQVDPELPPALELPPAPTLVTTPAPALVTTPAAESPPAPAAGFPPDVVTAIESSGGYEDSAPVASPQVPSL